MTKYLLLKQQKLPKRKYVFQFANLLSQQRMSMSFSLNSRVTRTSFLRRQSFSYIQVTILPSSLDKVRVSRAPRYSISTHLSRMLLSVSSEVARMGEANHKNSSNRDERVIKRDWKLWTGKKSMNMMKKTETGKCAKLAAPSPARNFGG